MKKFMSLFMAAAMVASFTACGGETKKSESTAAGESGAASETLVIGGSGPLTGDYASYGVSVNQGAKLAVEEINAKGGVNGTKLELKFEDDRADAATAVNAYATLMDNGMNVSLGGTTSGACIAVTEEIKKDGLLMLTPSGSQKDCTKYDNCFRVCYMDPDLGFYSANFIKEKQMASKVAIIYDKSNDYSVGITDAFVAQAKAAGLEIVTQQAFTNQSNTDFSVQLQDVKASGAELLFLPIYAQEAAYILTQARKMELNLTYFGVDGMDGVIEKIGKENVADVEGVILLTPFSSDSTEEPTASFVKNYKAKYKDAIPDQFAADGYDAVYIIAEAFKTAGVSVKAADFNTKMVEAMTKIKVKGVTGDMEWSKEGEPTKLAAAVKIVNGAYKAY
ncbi:MAG: ABC transporter substrate-binding protein [Oscillospiraceae bacterium]